MEAQTYATGTYFALHPSLTWEKVAEARRRWNIANIYAPIAFAPGCTAWGALFPSDYSIHAN
jgi:hypothetical protein